MYVNNPAGILRSPCQGKSLEDLRGLSPKLVRSTEGIGTSLEDAEMLRIWAIHQRVSRLNYYALRFEPNKLEFWNSPLSDFRELSIG